MFVLDNDDLFAMYFVDNDSCLDNSFVLTMVLLCNNSFLLTMVLLCNNSFFVDNGSFMQQFFFC